MAGSGKPHAEGSEDLGGKISTARNSGNVPQEDALKLSRRRFRLKNRRKLDASGFMFGRWKQKRGLCVAGKSANLAAGLRQYVRHPCAVVL